LATFCSSHEQAARLLPDHGVGRDEPAALLVERLVELGGHVRVLADLRLGRPFAAQPVEPSLPVLDEGIELVVTLEIAGEPEAEAQVIGPHAFSFGAMTIARGPRSPPPTIR
jgi:hypothetical protein